MLNFILYMEVNFKFGVVFKIKIMEVLEENIG